MKNEAAFYEKKQLKLSFTSILHVCVFENSYIEFIWLFWLITEK